MAVVSGNLYLFYFFSSSSHVIVFAAVISVRLSSPNSLSLFTRSGNDASHTLQITAGASAWPSAAEFTVISLHFSRTL